MNILAITICCNLALSTPLMAADTPDLKASEQWQTMRSLSPGTQVQVRRLDKTTTEGRFVSVDDNAIVVLAKSGELSIPRSAIRQIRLRRGSARLKAGAIGAAIGAAAGIAIGVGLGGALTDGDGVSSEATAAFGSLGAAIGFGVGLIPRGYIEIYKGSS